MAESIQSYELESQDTDLSEQSSDLSILGQSVSYVSPKNFHSKSKLSNGSILIEDRLIYPVKRSVTRRTFDHYWRLEIYIVNIRVVIFSFYNKISRHK